MEDDIIYPNDIEVPESDVPTDETGDIMQEDYDEEYNPEHYYSDDYPEYDEPLGFNDYDCY